MFELFAVVFVVLAAATLWIFLKAFAKAAVAGAIVGLFLGAGISAALLGLVLYLLAPQLLTVFMFICAAILGVHLVLNRVAVPPQHDTILPIAPPPLSAGIIFDGPTSPFYRPNAALPSPTGKPQDTSTASYFAHADADTVFHPYEEAVVNPSRILRLK
jgi:hypothetical protein